MAVKAEAQGIHYSHCYLKLLWDMRHIFQKEEKGGKIKWHLDVKWHLVDNDGTTV